jgi:ABC-type Fe3+-hydroxamate transport system substrate-binding protein
MGKEPVLFPPRCERAFAVLALAAAVSCGRAERPRESALRLDDFSDTILAGRPASRIVSLSPVTTEILFALGAGGRVVGRTSWDLYPEAARSVADLGNGMQPNVEAVLGVRPDLVVLYAGSANRGAAERLRRAGATTLAIRTDHIADFRRTVGLLALAVGDTSAGVRLADSVEASLRAVRARPQPAKPPTVFWFIWETPLYTIGRGSYLSELVETAGARNVFGDLAAPSPQVAMEEVARRNPDYILAGPVGAARIRAGPAWKAVPAVRAGRILVVDTTLVGRPGVRLGEAARHLRALILGDSVP